jgi:hypothetical protein
MFDVGATGTTILFMAFSLGQILIGWLVLSYAAHCLLVVVQETAAGTDEVVWPDEPMYDWLWKLWYLLWLAGAWLVPAGLVLGAIDAPPFHKYPWLRPAVMLGVFWVSFPVSLFSSLSAHSRWVILRPAALGWLLANFFSTVAFYILSALVLAGFVVFLGLPLVYQRPLALPAVGALAPAFLLVYSRLTGRMAWILNRYIEAKLASSTEPEEGPESKEREPKQAPTPPRRPPKGKRQRVKSYDPWAVPDEPSPEPDPGLPRHLEPGDVYGIQGKGKGKAPPPPPKKPKPRRVWVEEGADEPYALQPRSAEPERKDTVNLTEVSDYEMRLAQHAPPPPPPSLPLVSGVVGFLLYPATLKPLGLLACGGVVMGLFLWMQVLTWPF